MHPVTVNGALADALRASASMPGRAELGRASRAYAEATFSETAVIDRFLEMYRQTMAGPVA